MINITTPVKINNLEINNRLEMAPLVCQLSSRDGMISQENIDHYEQRAKAGIGLIVLEAICVRPEGRLHPKQLGIWSDDFIERLTDCADACHKHGAKIIGQIHHAGMSTNPDCGRKTGPIALDGYQVLDINDIEYIRDSFIDAGVRLQKAGFDGVQLHGCHSYLLNSFANRANNRDDQYGGNVVNRTRLASEILSGIRAACGENYIVTIRMAGNDPDIKDGIEIAEQYIKAGFDMLSVSSGIGTPSDMNIPEDFPFNDLVYRGYMIKKHLNPSIPVGAVGGMIEVAQCEKLVSDGYADIAELGRGILADYNMTKVLFDESAEFVKCFLCKSGCKWFGRHEKCPAFILRKKAGRTTP